MPEPIASSETAVEGSTPLELLKAVREVQERRVALWREYEDAFTIFLAPRSNAVSSSAVTTASVENGSNRGCAADTMGQLGTPISEDLLAQILQITTQGLIECSHRLRSIQLELRHTTSPNLAALIDSIQTHENTLLRSIVHRDQLRRSSAQNPVDTSADVDRLYTTIQATRSALNELMQEVAAETADLAAEIQ